MYKAGVSLVFLLVALMAPSAAHAAVVISEVAWMGTAVSANAEWIELQNTDDSSVNLVGWTLVSSSGAPAISLTGTIAAHGFYVLERTSDASVPEVLADQLYSGALPNGGVTLTLSNQEKTSVDVVVGGTDWKSIGGNNTTKTTPQRNGASWVTAVPTPGAVNATEDSVGNSGTGTASTTEDTATPQESVGGSPLGTSGNFSNPIPRLRISAGPGRIVAAGARVPYAAHVYDEFGTIRSDARFTWSFGDGSTMEGREVEHTYVVPGTYMVVVHASAGPSAGSVTFTVRADAIHATIERFDETVTIIRNDSSNVLDLSSWKLVDDSSTFVFPIFTALLPESSVAFPHSITGMHGTSTLISLQFPEGATVATTSAIVPFIASENIQQEEVIEPVPVVQPLVPQVSIKNRDIRIAQEPINNSLGYEEATSAPSSPVDPGVLGASVSGLAPLLKSPWTASFFGLILAAGAALVIL